MKYLITLLFVACTATSPAQAKTLIIADHLESCTGVGLQSCMLVKHNPEEEWSLFYDRISGFEYEAGYTYEIIVNEFVVDNPPADASSIRYELREIVSKVKTLDVSELYREWKVIKIKGLEQLSSAPTLLFAEEENRVSGFAGCNNYFSTYTVEDNALSFDKTGATRKLCPDMGVEDAFLKTLASVVRYEVVKKELHLYDIDDELLILAISE